MYLVTGATGNVGSALVDALAEAGQPVRALVRDPSKVTRGEAVAGDLNKPETFKDALPGVRGLFLMPGYAEMDTTLALAREAGVERIVLLSGGSAEHENLDNAVSRYMTLSERAVKASGLAWTFLRPRAFMSNALRWLPQMREGDVVRVPFGQVPVASIDPRDIAAVAARALVEDGHAGQIHNLTGPAQLLPRDQIAVLAKVLGRDLQCVELSNEEARAEMLANTPVEYVDAFFEFYVEGTLDEATVYPTVQEVTGRPPRTFEEWAHDHAEAFR